MVNASFFRHSETMRELRNGAIRPGTIFSVIWATMLKRTLKASPIDSYDDV